MQVYVFQDKPVPKSYWIIDPNSIHILIGMVNCFDESQNMNSPGHQSKLSKMVIDMRESSSIIDIRVMCFVITTFLTLSQEKIQNWFQCKKKWSKPLLGCMRPAGRETWRMWSVCPKMSKTDALLFPKVFFFFVVKASAREELYPWWVFPSSLGTTFIALNNPIFSDDFSLSISNLRISSCYPLFSFISASRSSLRCQFRFRQWRRLWFSDEKRRW